MMHVRYGRRRFHSFRFALFLGLGPAPACCRPRRDPWARTTQGAMCAIGSALYPRWATPLKVGYVASLATKLSDTFASEIGKVRSFNTRPSPAKDDFCEACHVLARTSHELPWEL